MSRAGRSETCLPPAALEMGLYCAPYGRQTRSVREHQDDAVLAGKMHHGSIAAGHSSCRAVEHGPTRSFVAIRGGRKQAHHVIIALKAAEV